MASDIWAFLIGCGATVAMGAAIYKPLGWAYRRVDQRVRVGYTRPSPTEARQVRIVQQAQALSRATGIEVARAVRLQQLRHDRRV